MNAARTWERRWIQAIEGRLDGPEPPSPILNGLGVPYLRARHGILLWAIRAGRLWVPSASRNAIAVALSPGDCCLDLGANIGRVTQEAAWRVGRSGAVRGFEPSPVAAARLRRRVERLKLSQVQVNERAVAERSGTTTFYDYPQRNGGTSSLRPRLEIENPEVTVREVPVVTVDDYLEKRGIETVALVKLDVEGAEVDALRGARRLLTRSRPRPVLIFEASALGQARFGRRVQDLLDTTHELGYVTWLCRPSGLLPVRREEELPAGRSRDDVLALHLQDHENLVRRLSRFMSPSPRPGE